MFSLYSIKLMCEWVTCLLLKHLSKSDFCARFVESASQNKHISVDLRVVYSVQTGKLCKNISSWTLLFHGQKDCVQIKMIYNFCSLNREWPFNKCSSSKESVKVYEIQK